MGYSGLVPSEYSTGNSVKRGAITKTGNAHLRRVLVEAAWAYRSRPSLYGALEKRQEGLSQEIKEIAWKAQHRLFSKYRRLVAKGKLHQKVVIALSRELLGFVWAIGMQVEQERRGRAA
jgi:transposase